MSTDTDAIATLRTIIAHVTHVRAGLERAADDLRRRSLLHDLSKLAPDEFDGFSRINRAAREHPYGSAEYRAGLQQEKPTIDLHYSRNSHHPEHFGVEYEGRVALGVQVVAEGMGWLDIVEMVCDWRAAYLTYGSQGTWEENIARQRERYKVEQWFTKGQWWLIEQIAGWVVGETARPASTPSP